MRNYLGFALWGALLFTAESFAAAQELPPVNPPIVNPQAPKTKGSTEKVQDTKIVTDSGTNKTSIDTLTGKVEDYQPAKSITVSTPGKTESTRTISLIGKDLTAHVDSSVKAGRWVRVTTKTDNNGHKTVTVERTGNAASTRPQ